MGSSANDFWLSAKLGYEKSYILNKNLQFSFANAFNNVEKAKFYENFLVLTATILRQIDLYAKVGSVASDIEFIFRDTGSNLTPNLLAQKTLSTWGFGGRVLFLTFLDTSFGMQASYQESKQTIMTLFNPVVPSSTSVNFQVDFYEWQIAAGLSHKIKMFIPYAGAKYYRARAFLTPSVSSLKTTPLIMRNGHKWGLFLGCDFVAIKYFSANVEGRLIDEEAITGSMNFRF